MQYDLVVKGVTKSFNSKGKKFYALKNINLSVKKGEVYGLLGPNGAGKTTLINVMNGIIQQDEGDVSILGMSNTNPELFERIDSVFAENYFHWALNPKEILRFYGRVHRIKKDACERKIKELVKLFELEGKVKTKFSQLSTGEKTRLAFAKALLNDPELLLLDEPTLGLDPNIAVKIRNFMHDLNKEKKITILLTSHYMQEVELLASKVAFINRGKIVDKGEISKVKLKHFNTYDLKIKPKVMKHKTFLKDMGFTIKGNRIHKEIQTDEAVSAILSKLHKKGILIDDIKIKKPSLEDYFIKLSK